MNNKVIVTSFPKAGTNYFTSVLKACGLKATHEKMWPRFKEERNKKLPWYCMAPWHHHEEWGDTQVDVSYHTAINMAQFETSIFVIWLKRHPLRQMESFCSQWGRQPLLQLKRDRSIASIVPTGFFDGPPITYKDSAWSAKAIDVWLWNHRVFPRTEVDRVVKIEDIKFEDIKFIGDIVGTPIKESVFKSAIENKDLYRNESSSKIRNRVNFKWGDFEPGKRAAAQQLCIDMGYDL